MSATAVLIDTGVLYAFLHRDDVRHAAARRLLEHIHGGAWGAPIVLDLVVSELFTLIRAREHPPHAEDDASALLFDRPGEPPRFRFRCLEPDELVHVASVFRAHRRSGFSYTDAALVAVREALPVDAIVSFDAGIAAYAPTLQDVPT